MCADHKTWRFIGNTEQQYPTAFIGQSNAILIKLAVIELILRFLEFQSLMLGRSIAPYINLLGRRSHIFCRVSAPYTVRWNRYTAVLPSRFGSRLTSRSPVITRRSRIATR